MRRAIEQIRDRDALDFARSDIGFDVVDLVAEFADLLLRKRADAMGPAGQPAAAESSVYMIMVPFSAAMAYCRKAMPGKSR